MQNFFGSKYLKRTKCEKLSETIKKFFDFVLNSY